MKINFYLKKELNKAGEAPIRVSVCIRGTRMMQSIGFTVDPGKWDEKKQQVKQGYTNALGKDYLLINSRIKDVDKHFSDYEMTIDRAPEVADLALELKKAIRKNEARVAAVHGGETNESMIEVRVAEAESTANEVQERSAYSYVDEYLKSRAREVSWTMETAKMNKTFKTHLGKFSKKVPLSYFNKKGLGEFIDYLRFTAGMEDTSVRKQYKNLAAFLNWCQDHNYADLPDVAKYHPVFKTPAKPVIFLTNEELMKLYNYKVPKSGDEVKLKDMNGREYTKTVVEPGALAKARDLFCFCAFTSLRYSDMANLHRYDIQDGAISVVTQKTNARLQIKLNTYAQAILDKYKDETFPGDKALPVISNQKLNQYIKEICELCGFNEPIHITGFRKGQRYDITRPKYSEISTHCGRKTFICFMLSIGVSPQVVMKFTGHADYKSMKPYIDIAEKAKTDAMDAMEKALDQKPKTQRKPRKSRK